MCFEKRCIKIKFIIIIFMLMLLYSQGLCFVCLALRIGTVPEGAKFTISVFPGYSSVYVHVCACGLCGVSYTVCIKMDGRKRVAEI